MSEKRTSSLFSENATSGHGNVTKFCRIIIVTSEIKPRKLQIDILDIGYFTEKSLKKALKMPQIIKKVQNWDFEFLF